VVTASPLHTTDFTTVASVLAAVLVDGTAAVPDSTARRAVVVAITVVDRTASGDPRCTVRKQPGDQFHRKQNGRINDELQER
jgi:hypothetical protein